MLCYNSEMSAEAPLVRRRLTQGNIQRSGDAIFFMGQERKKNLGSSLPNATSQTKDIYEMASDVFKVSIPELTLPSTDNTITTLEVQRANATANLAWLSLAIEKRKQLSSPRIEFGESFGEIMALRKIFKSDKDFLTFIEKRGQIMKNAALEHESASGEKTGLMSVTTRPSKTIEELKEKQKMLAHINEELTNPENNFGIYLATKTSKSRHAFGGTQGALDNALDYLKQYKSHVAGMDIKTGAAFHTPLYTGVKEPLAEYFKNLPFELQDPEIPIMSATLKHPIILITWQDGVDEILRLPEEPVYCVEMIDFADKIMRVNDIYIVGENEALAKSLAENPDHYKSSPVITRRRAVKTAGGVAVAGSIVGAGIAAWKLTLSRNSQRRDSK